MIGTFKPGKCSGCGHVKMIVFKRGVLCHSCNQRRKADVYLERQKKRPRFSKKAVQQMGRDVETYMKVWDSRPHYCEECGMFLGDHSPREAATQHKYVFSHILPKSVYPRLRHVQENFNLLCLKHHNMWENRVTQKLMNIWVSNKERIVKLLEENGYLE